MIVKQWVLIFAIIGTATVDRKHRQGLQSMAGVLDKAKGYMGSRDLESLPPPREDAYEGLTAPEQPLTARYNCNLTSGEKKRQYRKV